VSLRGVPYSAAAVRALDRQFSLSRTGARRQVIVRAGLQDEGPMTKLLGTLDWLRSSSSSTKTWVGLADDDVVYSPRVFGALRDGARDAGAGAVGFAARVWRQSAHGDAGTLEFTGSPVRALPRVTLLETYHGVLYDGALFPDPAAMRAFVRSLPSDAVFTDDISIAAWLATNGVARMLLADPPAVSHDDSGTEALRTQNLANRNEAVFKSMVAAGLFSRDGVPPISTASDAHAVQLPEVNRATAAAASASAATVTVSHMGRVGDPTAVSDGATVAIVFGLVFFVVVLAAIMNTARQRQGWVGGRRRDRGIFDDGFIGGPRVVVAPPPIVIGGGGFRGGGGGGFRNGGGGGGFRNGGGGGFRGGGGRGGGRR